MKLLKGKRLSGHNIWSITWLMRNLQMTPEALVYGLWMSLCDPGHKCHFTCFWQDLFENLWRSAGTWMLRPMNFGVSYFEVYLKHIFHYWKAILEMRASVWWISPMGSWVPGLRSPVIWSSWVHMWYFVHVYSRVSHLESRACLGWGWGWNNTRYNSFWPFKGLHR